MVGPGVIVCSPRGILGWRIIKCPTCDKRRKMLVRWEAWYGDTITCLTCADVWMDGECMPRPFRPKWRQERLARARQDLSRALSPKQHRAAIDEYLRREFADA